MDSRRATHAVPVLDHMLELRLLFTTLLCQWLLYLPAIGLNERLVSFGVGVMTVRLQGRARLAKSHHDDRTLE